VRLAFVGVLLHVLAHAAAKGNAFMGAGVLVRKFGTKELARVRDGISVLPWSGPMFLMAIFALSAMPPFGIFRSEYQIVAGGLDDHRNTAAVILVVLVTLAFLGLTASTTRMLFQPGPTKAAVVRGEPTMWMVVPVVAGVAVLILLGVAPPTHLVDLLSRGAAELAGSL
jgi:hydrogenase-4 component F